MMTLLSFLLTIQTLTAVPNVADHGRSIGFSSSKGYGYYDILLVRGMEVFEDGKFLDNRQTWMLHCHYPSNGDHTDCSLQTQTFYHDGKSALSSIIGNLYTYRTDYEIKIKQADWKAGKLDFSIVLGDRTTTEVSILMAYDKDSIYLKSFRAVNVGKKIGSDKLTVVEYKIPPYTYTVNYPIVFEGLGSEGDKHRNDLGTRDK